MEVTKSVQDGIVGSTDGLSLNLIVRAPRSYQRIEPRIEPRTHNKTPLAFFSFTITIGIIPKVRHYHQ